VVAREAHRPSRLDSWPMRQDLILVGEAGLVPLSQSGARVRFSFIVWRCWGSAPIATSNPAFPEGTDVFAEPRLTSTLFDRPTQRYHILELAAESCRFRQGLQRQASLAMCPAEAWTSGKPQMN